MNNFEKAIVKFDGGNGALLCNKCRTILARGFNHEDKEHFCNPECEVIEEDDLPFWRCSECGYEDHKKAMPKDRVKFYNKAEPGVTCPKCKSHACFVPVGF